MKAEQQPRRRLIREFKQDAVKMVTEQVHSIAEVANNLGINYNLLSRWKKILTQRNSVEVVTLNPEKLDSRKLLRKAA